MQRVNSYLFLPEKMYKDLWMLWDLHKIRSFKQSLLLKATLYVRSPPYGVMYHIAPALMAPVSISVPGYCAGLAQQGKSLISLY